MVPNVTKKSDGVVNFVESTDMETKNNKINDKSSTIFETKLVWRNVIFFLTVHTMGLWSIRLVFEAKYLTLLWCVILMFFNSMLICMAAHRLFSHRSYKANKWLRNFLILTFPFTGQNNLWTWVRDHRQHHKYSDTAADPHNASRGFFFSHMGWLMMRKHPEVIRKGRLIDMTDMNSDPVVTFQRRNYYALHLLLSVMIPIFVPCMLWDENLSTAFFICVIFRWIFTLHATWTINSVAHIFGTRPFNKNIRPTENMIASIITMGEGWHNYHHAFPWDYRASEYNAPFNITRAVIDFCARRGWVTDMKVASPELIQKYVKKYSDNACASKICSEIPFNEEIGDN